MGYIDWQETEPALFEAKVQASKDAGEGVYFRGYFSKDWITIQKGPECGTVMVDFPSVLSILDVDRAIVCFQVYTTE